MEEQEIIKTKVVLVGVDTGLDNDFSHSMEELQSLAEAAYKQVVDIVVQKMDMPNKAYYIGTGKVKEIKATAAAFEAEEVIFEDTLTPSQIRNLGDALDLPVYDRTNLILDIFALRAQTKEAKLQVETARLQYMLPRLIGMRDNLSRQGGTGGSMSNKGAGETKLELDRRKIEHRISELKKELETVAGNRQTMRKKRDRSGIPQVALVGYTNAGKSTIMNRLVGKYGENKEKTVFEKNMLFATLDTSIRTIDTGDKKPFFLSDTVGFINKLPHGLVKAFHSTLEEIKYADLCIHVVDYSDPYYKEHMQVTEETLKELEAGAIPRIVVFNKADLCEMQNLPLVGEDRIHMSAGTGIGLEELLAMIKDKVYAARREGEFLIPYQEGAVVALLNEKACVLQREYRDNGTYIKADCDAGTYQKLEKYLIS